MGNRLTRIALVLLFTVLLFEAALQVLSLVIHFSKGDSSGSSSVKTGDETRVILCCGDSFTFGMGSSGPQYSYPRQLETMLAEESARWRVVNAGWPGRNSAEVVRSIDALLTEHDPEILVLMVGANDSWSLPEPAELELVDSSGKVPKSGFRWECRTLRLIRTFRKRGAFQGDRLEEPTTPVEATETEIEAKASTQKVGPWDLVRRGDLAAAEKAFDESMNSSSVIAITGKIALRRIEGNTSEEDRLLAELDRLIAAGLTENETFQAIDGLSQAAMNEELVERFRGTEEKFPEKFEILFLLSNAYANLGDLEAALLISDHFAAILPDDHEWADWFWRTRARHLDLVDRHEDGVRAVIRAYVSGGKSAEVLKAFGNNRDSLAHASFPDLLQSTKMSAAQRAELESLWAVHLKQELAKEEPAIQYSRTLHQHLAIIVDHAASRRVRVAISGYPFKEEAVQGPLEQIAEERNLPFVANESEFIRRVTKGVNRTDELYVADGHCTDLGYEIIAAKVLDAIRSQDWLN